MSCRCGGSARECLCDERVRLTPLPIENRPGLPRIRRRVLTQATAKATMLRQLTRADLPATAQFTARADDDFAVAILDAAAVIADIVTFYTDRFVNEHYLRTAQEQRSLAELSRLIGYQPRPGLAPTADLAFTLDPSPGAPVASVIPAGTGVQSSPDPGQSPVVYETLVDLTASPRWNAIRPRRTVAHPSQPGAKLAFAGAVNLSIGDGVLYRTGGAQPLGFGLISTVTNVDAVPELPGRPGMPARTEVEVAAITTMVGTPPESPLPQPRKAAPVPDSVAWLAGSSATAADLDAALLGRSLTIEDVAGPFAASAQVPATAIVFPQQRALFGSQAPLASSLAASVAKQVASAGDVPAAVVTWASGLTLPWESATVASFPGGSAGDVHLDGASPQVAVGSLLVLRDGSAWGVFKVESADSVGVAGNGINGRAVRVHVSSTTGLTSFSLRRTTAFAGARALPLADVPASDTVPLGPIELDGLMLGLREGRAVVVTGEAAGDRGRRVCVASTLTQVVHDFGAARSTTITLADSLKEPMVRSTMTVAANVTPASQGETRTEVLGSGDGRQSFQRFTLRQPPLTYLSSHSASGLSSTLTVWVDGVRWAQVDSFLGHGADERLYIVRDTDGQTVVQFGDGRTGSRLPTGTANVKAVYRSGGALSGQVRAGQLSLPVSRAGGVTGVLNPAPSDGGDNPETVDSARVSAPLRVTTLDRVVSMDDYALFARAFPGVTKAHAVWARSGQHRGVLLTVAGDSGAILVSGKGIGRSLLGALRAHGDPLVPVALAPYAPTSFRFTATVRTDPARVRTDVLAEVADRLSSTFSFSARALGQSVAASEVLAVIQGSTGVIAAAITGLWKFDPSAPPAAPTSSPQVLLAQAPAPGADIGTPAGAELIVLDAAPIAWGVME